MSAWREFKKSLSNWQLGLVAILAFLGLITGALSQFTSVIFPFIPAPYQQFTKVVLLYLGAAILVWLYTHAVLTKRNPQAGVIRSAADPFQFNAKQRRRAKITRILSLIPVLLLVYWPFVIHKKVIEDCEQKAPYTAILVSKFSNNPKDDFSFQLINFLYEKISDSLIQLDNLDQIISLKARVKYRDSLAPLLSCYKNGMLIFGSRNIPERSFYCNVYMKDITEKGAHRVTDVKEPNIIELPFHTQCNVVGNFILSLIFYSKGEHQKSLNCIDSVLQDKIVQTNEKIKSVCYLYQGLNLLQTSHLEKSIRSFEMAYNFDKTNHVVSDALSYMRSLKIQEADFFQPDPATVYKLPTGEEGPDIQIKRSLPVNDSVGLTITDSKGTMIKNLVIPAHNSNFIILPSNQRWFTFYLDKEKVLQIGKGKYDSISCRIWLDNMNLRSGIPSSIRSEAVARDWNKVSDDKDFY